MSPVELIVKKEKQLAAIAAVSYIQDQQVIGLGTGSTTYYAIHEIGKLVKRGLQIKAIPTSIKTQQLAESLNIPLIDSNSVDYIDVTIDGADEFTEDMVLIKGGGGALLREKIVASMSRKLIIIADSSKQVTQLGLAFSLPIEVIPFGSNFVSNQIKELGGICIVRKKEGKAFVTDQGNWILDADFGHIQDPHYLSKSLNELVGIVCHGLFIGLADVIIVGEGNTTHTHLYLNS
ncbi:ribose-5-phosphate isomerase RpiA [Algoriphagus persicinus]|uniref:ribose-5-phosphate isomerase RpiA n=1 Tax=Algoriphagus persicinus TaxID=3108754 RepID=UPI002B3BB2E6|nr:ribose-5-phosphate isomerase RpiA [Algoriphagus sp. E1-3-M2]MEB2783956.1 ribose-5-phosphate isomerase RpiA [Algoriphagus sp. E1-3-M2]